MRLLVVQRLAQLVVGDHVMTLRVRRHADLGQVVADATHIKLLEGESPDQLVPLVGLMGQLEATILSVHHGG